MRARCREEGSALLTSLLIVTLAFLVLMAVTVRAAATVEAVGRSQREALAFNAAEAALAESVQLLMEGESAETSAPVELGIASYEVEETGRAWLGPARRVELAVTGRCKEQAAVLAVFLELRSVPGKGRAAKVSLLSWRRLPPGD